MKVKITKSIDIADKSPSMPIVKVVEGETKDDLSDHVANRLIELECATLVDEKAETEEPENTGDADNTDHDSTDSGSDADGTGDEDEEVTPKSLKSELEAVALEKMDGPMGSEKQAKAALEEIGKERYGFDVDKRLGVDKIVDAIVKAAFKGE